MGEVTEDLVVDRTGCASEGIRREFSPATRARIEALLRRYPTKGAALLPVLWIAQDEFGWISKETIETVAELLDLPVAFVLGVVTFYTMYHRAPIGRTLLQVCTSLSCHLCGSGDLLRVIEKKLGIRPGETTPDGEFTLEAVECIAACDGAPAMICGEEYVLSVDERKLEEIIESRRGAASGGTEG